MEQRPLRLGDILDDYCTRERRVTNHAIVALVEQDVKQTRCTTCDAEHVYKGGKAPRRKKSDATGALYKEVLAGITDQDAPPSAGPTAPEPADVVELTERPEAAPAALAADEVSDGDDADAEPQPAFDEGPVHRPLIRAQLARPEGIKLERQAPEFTIRQNPNGRGGSFRGGGGSGGGDMRSRGAGAAGRSSGGSGGGSGSNNGQRFGRGPRPAGGGSSRGPNQGFGRGPGNPGGGGQQRPGGPRKRSR